jgi:hypothetical protein
MNAFGKLFEKRCSVVKEPFGNSVEITKIV